MFCLRHYGRDANGKRTTINYFSSRAQAGAAVGDGAGTGTGAVAAAEASTTTVRTVISGDGETRDKPAQDAALALEIDAFAGVEFDAQAQAEMEAVLLALAERQRAVQAVIDAGGNDGARQQAYDPEQDFVRIAENVSPYLGTLEAPEVLIETDERFAHEPHWSCAGEDIPAAWADALAGRASGPSVPQIAEVKRPKRKRAAG
jgi:hypothetical protein